MGSVGSVVSKLLEFVLGVEEEGFDFDGGFVTEKGSQNIIGELGGKRGVAGTKIANKQTGNDNDETNRGRNDDGFLGHNKYLL